MAKNNGINRFVLGLAWCLLLAGCGIRVSAHCVVQTASKEVGVRERLGRNDGKRVEQYQKAVGLGRGYPWCAAFVKWCFNECKIETEGCTGWVPTWFTIGSTIYVRGGKYNLTPQSGDVFGVYHQNLRRVAHMGIIEKWEGDYVITIEGNTNNGGTREGDGVYRKRRSVKQVYKVARWTSS